MYQKRWSLLLLCGITISMIGMEEFDIEDPLFQSSQPLRVTKLFRAIPRQVKLGATLACVAALLLVGGGTAIYYDMREPSGNFSQPSEYHHACPTYSSNGFENGPCYRMLPPITWAIAQCELEKMNALTDHESCVPVCFTSPDGFEGVYSFPTDWEVTAGFTDYRWCEYHDSDVRLDNRTNFYLLCPKNSWFNLLREKFTQWSIPWCSFLTNDERQQGLVIPGNDAAFPLAIKTYEYGTVAYDPELMDHG